MDFDAKGIRHVQEIVVKHKTVPEARPKTENLVSLAPATCLDLRNPAASSLYFRSCRRQPSESSLIS